MAITITNIKFIVDKYMFYGSGERTNKLVCNGYDVDFIINKEIESKMTITTENEMTIDEIKNYIKNKLLDNLN